MRWLRFHLAFLRATTRPQGSEIMPKEKHKFSDKYDFSQMLIGARLLLFMVIMAGIFVGSLAVLAPILLFFTLLLLALVLLL